MVAYKSSPAYQKNYLYQGGNYRSPASMSVQNVQADDNNLDGIVRSAVLNELTPGYLSQKREYDLSKPIWFYKIMEMLQNSDADKEKKKTPCSTQLYISPN